VTKTILNNTELIDIKLEIYKEKIIVSENNQIFTGEVLQETEYVIGIVVGLSNTSLLKQVFFVDNISNLQVF